MKKQIFGGIAIVAIAIAVALNVNMVNKKSEKASLLVLANVEALAQEVTDVYSNNSYMTGDCSCPSCIRNAINVYNASTTVVNNSGITGGNINGTVAGTGGGVGVTGSQGQSLYLTVVINCGELAGACCNQALNGVTVTKVN